MVKDAEASRPEAANQLGAFQPYRQEMDSYAHNPASISERALLRQTLKVGARCGNAARRDLCGGPPERAVPTATTSRNHMENIFCIVVHFVTNF